MKFGVFKFISIICAWAYGAWLFHISPNIDGIQFSILNMVGTALFLTILDTFYHVGLKSDLTRNRSSHCACGSAGLRLGADDD